MKVREAAPRDIPALADMFAKLCSYLETKGQWLLNSDQKERMDGIVAFIITKMTSENNMVMVTDDENGVANGFVIGWILQYPSFYKYQVVGELQFLYPLSFGTGQYLRKAFDEWAKSKGATCGSNYATPGHTSSVKIFERAGRRLAYLHFFKPYGEGGV